MPESATKVEQKERAEFYVSVPSHFRSTGTIHRAYWYKIRSHWEWDLGCGLKRLPYGELKKDVSEVAAPFCKRCFPLEVIEVA